MESVTCVMGTVGTHCEHEHTLHTNNDTLHTDFTRMRRAPVGAARRVCVSDGRSGDYHRRLDAVWLVLI
jgi:hypothetical protein